MSPQSTGGSTPDAPLFVQDVLVPPTFYRDFMKEIAAIAVSTKALETLIPEQFAMHTKALVDVYKNAGQPSRPTKGPTPQSGLGHSSSAQSNAALRAQLAARVRASDPNESYTEGATGSLGMGDHWSERMSPGGVGNVLPLPRYPGAQPNTADLLNYMSTVAANQAGKRANKIYTNMQAGGVDFDPATGNPIGPLTQAQQAQADSALDGGRAGKVSDFLSQTEGAYAQSRYIKGIISKVAQPIGNMTSLGYSLGATSGQAGPLGLRFPWDNGAFGAGLGQKFSQFGFALDNNVSPGQAGEIYNQLNARGWFGGSATNDMRKAAGQMYSSGYGGVASQSAYYDAMDKSTRQGAESLSHFNDVMKQIPDAMKAAHLGMAQVMADADALGMYNKTIGGTYGAGYQKATEWNQITGEPASILTQLLQNPLVKGQMFSRTGLMPWEQGLASGAQTMNGVYGAINLLNKMVVAPAGTRQQIGNTGFYDTVSAQQRKEALMAQQLNIAPDVLHQLIAQQGRNQAISNVFGEATDYSNSVSNAVRGDNLSQAGLILAGQGKGNWGQLKGDLKKAGLNAQQIQQIQDLGQPAQGHSTSPGHGGAKQAWIQGTGQDASNVAWNRAWQIKQDLAQQTQNNGPKLTIELGPAAKKVLNLSDPNAAAKANNNAGTATIALSTATSGPTMAPYPDLQTASGPGTYDYGSQYSGSY